MAGMFRVEFRRSGSTVAFDRVTVIARDAEAAITKARKREATIIKAEGDLIVAGVECLGTET